MSLINAPQILFKCWTIYKYSFSLNFHNFTEDNGRDFDLGTKIEFTRQ